VTPIDASKSIEKKLITSSACRFAKLGTTSHHMGMLTVVAHERGYIPGIDDDVKDDGHLMSDTLGISIRRLPGI